ncbi:Uncharacterised protein [uncultured archaeon]|nr:Uncharacterised protein [uncultured archaeon]
MKRQNNSRQFFSFTVAPLTIYAVLFLLLNYPSSLSFRTHFFTDQYEGLTSIWKIWWVNKAVTQLHQSPWETNYVHYPYGVSFAAHTLTPFNGFLGIPLIKYFTLTETYNIIIAFSFIVGGLTAFLLAYYVSRSYMGSLIGGFIFTFSSYHFGHAWEHINLLSIEWIPLFILAWIIFIKEPRLTSALSCALILFLNQMCDIYYFLFCVIAGILILVWQGSDRKGAFTLFWRSRAMPLLTFILAAAALTGPLVISFIILNKTDPLLGAHPSTDNSLDLLAPIIPGFHWRFADITRPFWRSLPVNVFENASLGLSVLFVVAYALIERRKIYSRDLNLWILMLLFFGVMSMGPILQVWGHKTSIPLPYVLLEKILPPLQLSGAPIRMVIMAILSASVLCAVGFGALLSRKSKAAATILLILLLIEYLPRPLPTSDVAVPDYILMLKSLPGNEGLIDTVHMNVLPEYYQIYHEKPIAFSLLARTPTSVEKQDQQLKAVIEQKDYVRLCDEYSFRYLITQDDVSGIKSRVKIIYEDLGTGLKLVDMKPNGECFT